MILRKGKSEKDEADGMDVEVVTETTQATWDGNSRNEQSSAGSTQRGRKYRGRGPVRGGRMLLLTVNVNPPGCGLTRRDTTCAKGVCCVVERGGRRQGGTAGE